MVTLSVNQLTAPGVYVTQDTAGIIPASLASFNRAYMVGTSAIGDRSIPTQVISVEDFTNQFGSSASLDYVKLFFRNAPNSILYFVRAGQGSDGGSPSWTITVNAPGTFTLLINGVSSTITNNGSSSTITVPSGVTSTIAGNVITLNTGVGQSIILSSPSSSLTLVPANQSNLYAQLIYSIENAFDADRDLQGFLICPEGFQYLTSTANLDGLAAAMELKASAEGFDWAALTDASAAVTTLTAAQVERARRSSAFGHSSYFYPYVISLESTPVPSSVLVAAIALVRYRSQGFQQPPAGAQFPAKGVIGVTQRVTKLQQSAVNELGINCIRFFPNTGYLVYGSRTLSTNPQFRFINTRVILNVLIGTLRTAFDTIVFNAVDGEGVVFAIIRGTAEQICYALWDGGALFGATPQDAYAVVCNRQVNPSIDLENGAVRAEVFVSTSPTLERLLIGVNRVAIDQVQVTVSQLTGN